jgi:hypothetical protein
MSRQAELEIAWRNYPADVAAAKEQAAAWAAALKKIDAADEPWPPMHAPEE